MPAAPPQVANFIRDVVALKTRVRNLELAALRKSASTLKIKVSDLVNAKVFGAVNHQVFTYMDGDWKARGGPTIPVSPAPVTDSIDGVSVSSDLVTDWPDDVGCRVTATLIVGGSFADVPIPADPYDRIYAYPYATIQLTDGGGPPASPPYTEFASTSWHLDDGHERTIAWDFLPGTVPHVEANLIADPTAYPGDATLTVLARVSPLP